MINNLPIAFYTFARSMLSSLSIDEMLLLRYANWFTIIRGLPLRVKIAPFCLKLI